MSVSSYRSAIRALVLCSLTAAAGAADPADTGFKATPLAGSVILLQGHECNIATSAGEDGVVVVDTCGTGVADQLLASVKRLSSKPIRFVINTHAHADHSGGDAAFQNFAPVIAHDNVRKRMAAGNEVTGDKPSSPEALPIITFDGELTLHLNGDEIRLLKLPPGHTDSDVAVFFRKANVVCLGDVFMSPAASFGDRHFGGGMLALIQALEFVLPQIPNDAKVVPGHGVVSTRADVVRGLEVLNGMKAVVEAAVRDGKTLEQLTAERPFDKWRDALPAWAS
ncbi:MAG TPA: MBL fold metallo-hydrolase, partial [Steroidobacteraceae bacterium]|nr:MBL fold metallo-hydrolase [Steroidobacteraceae bacterium]